MRDFASSETFGAEILNELRVDPPEGIEPLGAARLIEDLGLDSFDFLVLVGALAEWGVVVSEQEALGLEPGVTLSDVYDLYRSHR